MTRWRTTPASAISGPCTLVNAGGFRFSVLDRVGDIAVIVDRHGNHYEWNCAQRKDWHVVMDVSE